MLRKLIYLAPLAILGLAACDGGPAALTKAKEGECYTVTGKEPGGAPKWEKTECADQATVTAPIEPAAGGETAATAITTGGACPTAQPVKCPTVAAAAPERKRGFWRRSTKQTQQATRTRSQKSPSRSERRDYERVYTPDYPQQDLLGGLIDRSETYSSHSRGYSDNRDYAYSPPPPPPPVHRYERRDYGSGQVQGYRSEEHRSESYRAPAPRPYYPPVAPPPPPPPPPMHNEYAYSGGHGSGYASGYRAEQSTRHVERRSYSSSSSSSSHSSGGYGCPSRCGERSSMAPMNGPHFPVDQDGYLTWRGKTR